MRPHPRRPAPLFQQVWDVTQKFGTLRLAWATSVRARAPIGYREAGVGRGGWNWFLPSNEVTRLMTEAVGYTDVRVMAIRKRTYAVATRERYVDMLRAGLSVRTVR